MKSALFLKVFFATAVPFGLLLGMLLGGLGALIGALPGVPFSLAQGAIGGLTLGSVAGLLFGIAMAAILGGLHFSRTADPRVRHRRTVVLDASPEQAKSMCMAAINRIPNASVEEESSTGFRIVAKKGLTWRSWGDSITCDIRSTGPSQQTIVIESRPSLRTTLVDYGSNLENVDAIVSYFVAKGARVAADTGRTT